MFVSAVDGADGEGRAVEVREASVEASSVLIGRVRPGRFGATRVEVVVRGWRFEFVVEPEERARLRERAVRVGAAAGSAASADVRAMIPGRVVSVAVAAGDAVRAGQPLLVVEAMKMQNEVRAPTDGLVARVAVGIGESVELGDTLVVLEPAAAGAQPAAAGADVAAAERA